ncbi:hypothetical protein PGIGA_G00060260, partial [Pangasianodon gigas]|nr:hypothetical protein [Pangasianodon gigas]
TAQAQHQEVEGVCFFLLCLFCRSAGAGTELEMKSFWLFLSFFFSVFLCCSASAFDGVLGSTASCHKTCRMTYSLHTYPREVELFACQRGCRLFSICQFVGDSENLNQTKSECESACNEAYDEADEQFACSL